MNDMEQMFDQFLDISLDSIDIDENSKLEPAHVKKDKMKINSKQKFNSYIDSLNRGYELIIKELDKK